MSRRRSAPPCLALAVLAWAAACSSSGSAPVPGAAAAVPTITSTGTDLDVNFNPSRGVVIDVIHATPEAVWAVLPKAYADVGIPVREVSDASRTLGNPRFLVSRRLGDTPLSRYLECGSGITGPFADRYRIEMLIRTAVVPDPQGGVHVETYVDAKGRNPEGSSNTQVACASTQHLEREIAQRVRALAGGGA